MTALNSEYSRCDALQSAKFTQAYHGKKWYDPPKNSKIQEYIVGSYTKISNAHDRLVVEDNPEVYIYQKNKVAALLD